MARFQAGLRREPQGYDEKGCLLPDKKEWAVFCNRSLVWYFPTKKGKGAAEAYARRLNQEDERL